MLVDQQPGDAPREIIEIGIGPAAMVVDEGERVRVAALKQLRCRVQPLWIFQLGQVEAEFWQQLRCRQPLLDEAVALHSGTTAVVSISISAALSTSPEAST